MDLTIAQDLHRWHYDFKGVGLTNFRHSGHLALKSASIPSSDIFQLEGPTPVTSQNELIAVLMDEAISSNVQNMRVGISHP